MTSLSEYEQLRLRNIERNALQLQQIGLIQNSLLSSHLSGTATTSNQNPNKNKNATKKRKINSVEVSIAPTRRSSRLTDKSVNYEVGTTNSSPAIYFITVV